MRFEIRRLAIGIYFIAGTSIAGLAESYLIVYKDNMVDGMIPKIFEVPFNELLKGMLKLPFFFYIVFAFGFYLIIRSFFKKYPNYESNDKAFYINNCDNENFYYGWILQGSVSLISVIIVSSYAVYDFHWNWFYIMCAVLFAVLFEFTACFGFYVTTSFMRNYIVDNEGITILYPFGKQRFFCWDDFKKMSFEPFLVGKPGIESVGGYMLIIWHKDVKPADSSSLYKDTHFYNLKNVLLCYIPELHDRLFSFAPDRLKNMIRNMPKEYGTFNKKNNPYEKKSAKYYLAAAICIYIGIVYVFFFTG